MQVLKIEGDMDASTMPGLAREFEKLATHADDVHLDMRNVTFIDSSGIGGLVFLFKRLNVVSKRLHLTGVTGQPRHLLMQLRLTMLIDDKATRAA